MDLIVAVDSNWAIGNKGKLLYHLPEDLKYFKEKTLGKTVIMGRKTLYTLPGGKPLKARENIILSSDLSLVVDGAIVLHSVEELKEYISSHSKESLMLIGGASLYERLLPLCENAWVTKIKACANADKFFPDLDKHLNWELTLEGELNRTGDLEYSYCKYTNRRVSKQ